MKRSNFLLSIKTKKVRCYLIHVNLVFVFLFNNSFYSQNIEIPDINFKQALISKNVVDFDFDGIPESDADTNNDGEIQLEEALAVEVLIIRANEINSLEGIEYFSNLIQINCSQNLLEELDFSQNLELEQCSCFFNNISIVNFSENSKLKKLDIDFNQLTSINLTSNELLERAWLTYNNLQEVLFSTNNVIKNLNVSNNNLVSINNEILTELNYLSTSNNNLSEIDISNNEYLEYLDVYSNQLTELDVSFNSNITQLICLNNNLEILNLNNNNNELLEVLRAENNPSLNCITVDDLDYAESQEDWVIDTTSYYSEDCNLGLEDIILEQFIIYPNPTTDKIFIENNTLDEIESIKIFSLSGRLILEEKNNKNYVSLDNFSDGAYMIVISTRASSIVKKVLIN